jgi:heparosan-N-sulfate-glucuronate 5-epimerase
MLFRVKTGERVGRAFNLARWFPQQVGGQIASETVKGYYIDLTDAAKQPGWPPPWLHPGSLHVGVCQWGLASYDRYLAGDGEEWLTAALAAGNHLLETQEQTGPFEGGWVHRTPFPHTYSLQPPWLSGIVQGQAASLLVRLHLETGEGRFADGARGAVRPLSVPIEEHGLLARLNGESFPEEYPTDPPSFVLNGGIYALWGHYDIWLGLGDADAKRRFEDGSETLAQNLHRWDTGFWSRYDLYPHRIVNLAAPWYHTLHICQLRVFNQIAPRSEFAETANRFESYAASKVKASQAFTHKVVFRLLSPKRNPLSRLRAQR